MSSGDNVSIEELLQNNILETMERQASILNVSMMGIRESIHYSNGLSVLIESETRTIRTLKAKIVFRNSKSSDTRTDTVFGLRLT